MQVAQQEVDSLRLVGSRQERGWIEGKGRRSCAGSLLFPSINSRTNTCAPAHLRLPRRPAIETPSSDNVGTITGLENLARHVYMRHQEPKANNYSQAPLILLLCGLFSSGYPGMNQTIASRAPPSSIQIRNSKRTTISHLSARGLPKQVLDITQHGYSFSPSPQSSCRRCHRWDVHNAGNYKTNSLDTFSYTDGTCTVAIHEAWNESDDTPHRLKLRDLMLGFWYVIPSPDVSKLVRRPGPASRSHSPREARC